MNVDTAQFLCLIVLSLGIFYCRSSLLWRQSVLLGTSAAFVTAFFATPIEALPLITYLITIFCCLYALTRKQHVATLWAGIAVLVGAFLVLKNYLTFASWQQSMWITVGISYIMFRAIHVLVDVYDGSLERPQLKPLDLLLYLISPFTFAAGPIQRYDEFHEQLHALPEQSVRAINAPMLCGRIVKGLLKAVAIAPLFLGLHQQFVSKATTSPIALSVSAVSFLTYLYLNFSGSMDIVIGVGGFYGFSLPENFNKPYLARNFLDLWNRWHITLSSHFKTYVFFPFIRAFQSVPVLGQYPLVAGVLGFFIVFFLLGIWHGNTSSYVLYGLILGAAAAVNKGWEQWRLRYKKTSLFKEGSRRRYLIQAVSSAATFAYLCLALVSAWPSVGAIGEMLSIYSSVTHVVVSFLAITAILFLARVIIEAVVCRLPARSPSPWLHPALVSLGLVIILLLKSSGQDELSALNFYQRF